MSDNNKKEPLKRFQAIEMPCFYVEAINPHALFICRRYLRYLIFKGASDKHVNDVRQTISAIVKFRNKYPEQLKDKM